MSDRRLETRLRLYYAPMKAAEASQSLRSAIDAIPDETPASRSWRDLLRTRPALVFAACVLLLALFATALWIGSQLQPVTPFKPPAYF